MRKDIYIHVGPPKTGTSAAQKWLSDNQSFLEKNGVLYPPHTVDQNGVSSGNVRTIFDVSEDKHFILNVERLSNLLDKFYKGNYTTLLLSSEFFFIRMIELKKHIPNAVFIAYVRNPLEVKESGYNQSVKRHFQVERINTSRSKRLPHMARLVEYVNLYNKDDLYLRLFGQNYFKNGNIVSDLLSVLGIELQISLPRVNSSYQFEALEYKRWLNQFQLNEYQVLVDRALQGYSGGTSHYSLIHHQQYVDDSTYYSELIENYALELECKHLKPLISDMKKALPKPYVEQNLSEVQFLSMCKYLQSELKVDYYLLSKKVGSLEPINEPHFQDLFVNSFEHKYTYINLLLRARSTIKKALYSLKAIIK